MTRLVLTSRVGPDGVLKLAVPMTREDADKDVRVIVESLGGPPAMTRDDWLRFIARTAGSISDPSFERPPQDDYEQRDSLP